MGGSSRWAGCGVQMARNQRDKTSLHPGDHGTPPPSTPLPAPPPQPRAVLRDHTCGPPCGCWPALSHIMALVCHLSSHVTPFLLAGGQRTWTAYGPMVPWARLVTDEGPPISPNEKPWNCDNHKDSGPHLILLCFAGLQVKLTNHFTSAKHLPSAVSSNLST